MKTIKNSVTTNKTDKTSKDIRSNALFTDITAQEEVFVRGGAQYDESGPGIVHRK
ncbi:hypothetical protein [Planktothrix sp. FACHB-1365]|nr:hypothetical protein [Planktothrix sp. FACHB-1365]MBD2485249.1 hypothetical protein [Planktothrix sp. FACHB-1365]